MTRDEKMPEFDVCIAGVHSSSDRRGDNAMALELGSCEPLS